MVSGFTGLTCLPPVLNVSTMGEEPSGCARCILVLAPSISPTSTISWMPFHIFVYSSPEAAGTTQWSGALHPSYSTVS